MSGSRRKVTNISQRSEEAKQAFREGVRSVCRQWTALELAVSHQWGGADSAEKADNLVAEIIALFEDSTERIYKDVILFRQMKIISYLIYKK
jgi:hypothetical protein